MIPASSKQQSHEHLPNRSDLFSDVDLPINDYLNISCIPSRIPSTVLMALAAFLLFFRLSFIITELTKPNITPATSPAPTPFAIFNVFFAIIYPFHKVSAALAYL